MLTYPVQAAPADQPGNQQGKQAGQRQRQQRLRPQAESPDCHIPPACYSRHPELIILPALEGHDSIVA